VAEYVKNEEVFCFTYGDGVGDVDITASIAQHRASGRLATLTATYPPGRFGQLDVDTDGRVRTFKEKPRGDGGVVNGGFFVLQPEVVSYIEDEATMWEQAPLERLAQEGQLGTFVHEGFWQPMDTLRDKTLLEQLWQEGRAPWKRW